MPSFFDFHQFKCSAGMWWTGLLILHALGASCQQTGPEYLSNESGAESWSDSRVDRSSRDLPKPIAMYLYLSNANEAPNEVNCSKCLKPFLISNANMSDFCRCLPCVHKLVKDDVKLVRGLMSQFLSLDCSKTGNRQLGRSGTAKQMKSTTGDKAKTPKRKGIDGGSKASRKQETDEESGVEDSRRMYGDSEKAAALNGYYNPPERGGRSYESRFPGGRKKLGSNRKAKQGRQRANKSDGSEDFGALKNQPRSGVRGSTRADEEIGNLERGALTVDNERLKKIFGEIMEMVDETKKKNLDDSLDEEEALANDTESRRQNFEDTSKLLRFPQRRTYMDMYMNKYNRPSYKLKTPVNGRKTKRPREGKNQGTSRRQIPESGREPDEIVSDLHGFHSSEASNARELHPKAVKKTDVRREKTEESREPSSRRKNLMRMAKKMKKRIKLKKTDKSPLKQLLEDVGSSSSNLAKTILESSSRNVKMKEVREMEVTTVENRIEQRMKSEESVETNEDSVEESLAKTDAEQTWQKNHGEEDGVDSTTSTEMETWKQDKTRSDITEGNGTDSEDEGLRETSAEVRGNDEDGSYDLDTRAEDEEYEDGSDSEATTISQETTLPGSDANEPNEKKRLESEGESSSDEEDEDVAAVTPSNNRAAESEITTQAEANGGTTNSRGSLSFKSHREKPKANSTGENAGKGKAKKEKLLKRSTRGLTPITEPTGNGTQTRGNDEDWSHESKEKHEKKVAGDKGEPREGKNIHGIVVKQEKLRSKPENSESGNHFDAQNAKNDKVRAKGKKKPKEAKKNTGKGGDEGEENDSMSAIVIVRGGSRNPNQSIQVNLKLNDEEETEQLLDMLAPILEMPQEAVNGIRSPNAKGSKDPTEETHSDEYEDDYDPDYEPEDYDYELRASHDPESGEPEEVPEYPPEGLVPRARKSQSALQAPAHSARNFPSDEFEASGSGEQPEIATSDNFGGRKYPEGLRRVTAEMHHPAGDSSRNGEARASGKSPAPPTHLARRRQDQEKARLWNDFWRSYTRWNKLNGYL